MSDKVGTVATYTGLTEDQTRRFVGALLAVGLEIIESQHYAALAASHEKLVQALEECAEALELALARLGCPVEGNDGGGAGRHDADSMCAINTLDSVRAALAHAAKLTSADPNRTIARKLIARMEGK